MIYFLGVIPFSHAQPGSCPAKGTKKLSKEQRADLVEYYEKQVGELEYFFNECCDTSCDFKFEPNVADLILGGITIGALGYTIYRGGRIETFLDKVVTATGGLSFFKSAAQMRWGGENPPCLDIDRLQRKMDAAEFRKRLHDPKIITDFELIVLCNDISGMSDATKRSTLNRILSKAQQPLPEKPEAPIRVAMPEIQADKRALLADKRTVERNITKSLSEYNPQCDDLSKSRSPECTSAVARFCRSQDFSGGFSQEVPLDSIFAICLNGDMAEVNFSTLASLHGGCTDRTKSQTADCMAAAHRYCAANAGTNSGIIQDTRNNFARILCFNGLIRRLTLDTLRKFNPRCDSLSDSQHPFCVTAIHKYCEQQSGSDGVHFSGGISQEVPSDSLVVSCVQGSMRHIRLMPQ